MSTGKLFRHNNKLAISLPRKFHVKGEKVEIINLDGDLLLRDPQRSAYKNWDLFGSLPNDFMKDYVSELWRIRLPVIRKVPPQMRKMKSEVSD
jgi:virulence-associated protein VagC